MRFEALSTDVIRALETSWHVGRERGNTFNQGADGRLIECVEKSGSCDNILFPHSASAHPGFCIRALSTNSSPALSKDGLFSLGTPVGPLYRDMKLGSGEGGLESDGLLHKEPNSPL